MNPNQLADEAARLAERANELAQHAQTLAGGVAAVAPEVEPFVFLLAIFLMACFVGYYVVWNVTPALHSPLMSVTNAISSVIVVGAMLADRPGHQRLGDGLRLHRRDPGQRQHLRRVPGDPPNAVDVQAAAVGHAAMSASLTSLCYLVAAVLFILALRGLSHPEPSRQGNRFGMIGMAVAVVATLAHHGMSGVGYGLILLGILIGGSIGAVVAHRIQMTALPQLVAAFHSLVGLAAVFVAASALNAPEAFGIGVPGAIYTESLIEMSIGLAIGAITFTGSLIAFAKLQALMSGAPITFPGQHKLNLGLGHPAAACWSSRSSSTGGTR